MAKKIRDRIESSKRNSKFVELKPFDHTAKEHDYIEATEWSNLEGFDVEVNASVSSRFQLTWAQWDVLKELVKSLDNSL